jgi:hypothetical protein
MYQPPCRLYIIDISKQNNINDIHTLVYMETYITNINVYNITNHINGNHYILSLIEAHEINSQCIIINFNIPSNNILGQKIFVKLQHFISSSPLNCMYGHVMHQIDTSMCGLFVIAYAIDI